MNLDKKLFTTTKKRLTKQHFKNKCDLLMKEYTKYIVLISRGGDLDGMNNGELLKQMIWVRDSS
jgi:hypothetical protein